MSLNCSHSFIPTLTQCLLCPGTGGGNAWIIKMYGMNELISSIGICIMVEKEVKEGSRDG